MNRIGNIALAIIAGVALATGGARLATAIEGSIAQTQKTNNDRVMAIQYYGGMRESTGEVTITFYGSSAFEIISPRGVEVFIDPWRNDPTGVWGLWYQMEMPITETDVALITHAHFDHDGYNRLEAAAILDRMVGTWELGDVKVIGIAEKHVCEPQGKYPYRSAVIAYIDEDPCPPGETTQWNNNLFVVETGGLRILHWGDNRQNPPEYIWDWIGDIDIALLAVSDDGHILSHDWGDFAMEKTNAKVAIPHHYYVKGIGIPNAGGLEPAIEWTKKHEHTILDTHTATFTPESVKDLKHHVIYFGDHVPFPVAGSLPPELPEMPPVPDPVNAWQRYQN